MRKIYLIRHGLPDFPGGQRMCLGITDIPMGEAGLEQARQMAQNLPSVTAVFSSPLIRAVQTAQAIGMPITILKDLREMDMGEWDGLTFSEIRVGYRELYEARGADLTLPVPGAEDHGQAAARFQRAVEEAVGLCEGDFAIVAHGGIIAEFLQAVCGQRIKPDYAEVILISYENGRFRLIM